MLERYAVRLPVTNLRSSSGINAFDERSTLIMLDPFPDERQIAWRKYLAADSAYLSLVHKSKITAYALAFINDPDFAVFEYIIRYKWFVPTAASEIDPIPRSAFPPENESKQPN